VIPENDDTHFDFSTLALAWKRREKHFVLLSSFENETKQNFQNSASSSSREQTNINIRQDRAREVNIFGFPLAPDDQDTKIT
jgi:hypothetical protein